ncbi:MAG: PDZ domain-containing protein [Planctomycetes bacterium]|nr:PDZ domain-containing protein [Planctomycetota bacterium]
MSRPRRVVVLDICRTTALVAVLLVACLFAVCRPASAQDGASVEDLEERAFKQAAALVGPSVVRIQTVGGLDRVGQLLTGTGPTTGVIVSSDGYIISSSFNFIAMPATILVQFPNEEQPVPAKVVATDHSKMLTLLKVDGREDLVPATAAPKDTIRVGQWAIALGRAFDVAVPSISVGIVSATDRIWGKAIQTDAKVSPVNYGGPLVDVEGRVLGILVPLSPQGTEAAAGVEWYDSGIGFAIPLADIYAALDRLKQGEDLHPGLMGISFKGGGLLGGDPVIDRVRADSPAERAGLKAQDVIARIDDRDIRRQAEVKHALGGKYAGEIVGVTVRRGDETIDANITLVDKLVAYESGFLGILPVREPIEEAHGLQAVGLGGVGVRYIYPDSPAAKAGLLERDRIVKFADKPVTGAAELADLVSRTRPGEKSPLTFRRGEDERTVEVELAAVPNLVPAEMLSATIPPPEKAPEALKTGHHTVELADHMRSYWACVPDQYNPAYRYGLMVFLHPKNDTMEADMLDVWKTVCEQRGMILIAPRAADIVAGWTPNDAEFVKDATDDVLKKYSVDPERIVVHGYADGGEFAFGVAFKHRETYRGVLAASAPVRERPEENHPEFRLQFYLATGDKDPQRQTIQTSANGLRSLKYPVVLSVIPDWDHKYPPLDAIAEMARWADSLDRI